MADGLPDGLIRVGGTPEFTQDTIPDGLRAAHALAPGRWGLLHVLEGRLVFVDEVTGADEVMTAPDSRAILPELRHHVRVAGPVVCRIDFYRAPTDP